MIYAVVELANGLFSCQFLSLLFGQCIFFRDIIASRVRFVAHFTRYTIVVCVELGHDSFGPLLLRSLMLLANSLRHILLT